MSSRTLLIALALALSPVGLPVATGEAEAQRPADVLVETEPIILPHLLASAEVPEARCPDYAPHLLGETFPTGGATGTIGSGIELRIKGGLGVDAYISRFTTAGIGGAGGRIFNSITNWTPGKKSVQMVLHCG